MESREGLREFTQFVLSVSVRVCFGLFYRGEENPPLCARDE